MKELEGRYFKIDDIIFDESYVYFREINGVENKTVEIVRNRNNDTFEIYNNDLYSSIYITIEDKDEITKEEFMKVYNECINKLNKILQ